ncbi:MAG: flippase [Armatimonadota bacterium]|nr:flippase [Armatimonadota bacterium]
MRSRAALEISSTLLVRNGMFNLAAQVVPFVIGLVSVPAIVHGLGTERFGVLIFTWTLLGTFSVFDLGLGWAVTKFVAEALGRGDRSVIPGIVWSGVGGQALFGTIGGAVLIIGAAPLALRFLHVAPEHHAEAIRAFQIVGLTLPIVLISVSFRGALEAAQRFELSAAAKAVSSASTYLVPAGGVLAGWGLPGILGALLGVRFLLLAATAAACVRVFGLPLAPRLLDRDRMRRLASFGAWVAVSGLVGLTLSADRFLIGNALTMTALTYYTIPLVLIGRLTSLAGNLASVLFPAFSTLNAQDLDRVRLLFGRTVKYVILLAGPVFGLVAVTARDILRVWLGDAIAAQTTPILQILSAGAMLQVLAIIPYTLLQGCGRSDLTARFHLIEAPLYLGAVWWLVQSQGIRGVAAAWSARSALELSLLLWAAKRHGGWRREAMPSVLKRVVAPVVALCVLAAAAHALPGALIYRSALVATLVVMFALWVRTSALSADERRWLLGLLASWRRAQVGPR